MKYEVTHNGYRVEWFETDKEALDWVHQELEKCKKENDLELNLLSVIADGKNKCIVYQYPTLYCEVFTIILK